MSVQVDGISEFTGDVVRACQTLGIALVTIAPRAFRDERHASEPPSPSLRDGNDHPEAYLPSYDHERPHIGLGWGCGPLAYDADGTPRTVHTT